MPIQSGPDDELTALRAEADEAANEAEQLKATRKKVLLEAASDDEVKRHDERTCAAEIRRDRALARIEALQDHVAAQSAIADQEQRRKAYDAAIAQVDHGRAVIKDAYPRLRAIVRPMMRAIADAEAARAEANKNRPEGVNPIEPVESFRNRAGIPMEVIARSHVTLWVDARGMPVSDKWQNEIVPTRADPSRGIRHTPGGNKIEFERKEFERVEYLPAVPAQRAPSLAASMSIPGLHAGDPAVWEPVKSSDANAIIAALTSIDLPKASAPERTPKVEFIRVKA